MAEVEIKVKIDGVEYTQDQLKDLAKGAKKAGEGMDDLGKKTKDAGKEATIFDDIKGKFSDMTGGIKKVVTSFKTLKGAIAATGVGALVVALGTLISYFTTTEEGSKKLAIATETLKLLWGELTEIAAGLGEKLVNAFKNPKQALLDFGKLIVDNIIERFRSALEVVGSLGSALMNVFKGNFKAALDDVKNAGSELVDVFTGVDGSVEKIAEAAPKVFNKVKEAIAEATETATKLVDATRSIRDEQQRLIVENANLNKELEEQRKIAEDTTRTYDERKAALEKVGETQIKLAENLKNQAAAEENLLKLQIENESNYEKREELETQLAEATAARIESETALSIVELEASKLATELDLEELDRKTAINDTIAGLRLANIQDAREKAFEELRIAEEQALAELDLLKATEEQKQAVRDEFAKARTQLNRETTENELQLTQDAFSTISGAFEEGTAAFKVFKSAETIISTYSAAQKAYESAVGIPVIGPAIAPGVAAAAVASGLATLRQINSTEVPQYAFGGMIPGPSHSAGGTMINAEGGEFMINKYAMRQPGVAQIAEALNGIATPASQSGSGMAPIKTYILESEVTSAQEATQKIKNLARL